MKEGHHKVFTLFGGTKLLTCNSQVGPSHAFRYKVGAICRYRAPRRVTQRARGVKFLSMHGGMTQRLPSEAKVFAR